MLRIGSFWCLECQKPYQKREPKTLVFVFPPCLMFSFGAFFCHPSAPLALGSWSARKLKKKLRSTVAVARAPKKSGPRKQPKSILTAKKGVGLGLVSKKRGGVWGLRHFYWSGFLGEMYGEINFRFLVQKQSDGWYLTWVFLWMLYRACKCWWTVSYQRMMNCGPCGMTCLFIEVASKNH